MNTRITMLILITFIGITVSHKTAVAAGPGTQNSIGLAFSSLSGAGISLQHQLAQEYYGRITGLYYENRSERTNDKDPNDTAFNHTVFWDMGGEIQRNLYSDTNSGTGIYLLTGGSYWHSKRERPFEPEKSRTRNHYAWGAGIGFRILLRENVSLNADLTYQYTDWLGYRQKYVGPGAGIGGQIIF